MDASQRLEIIRSKFKRVVTQATKPAGLHVAAHPETKCTKRKGPSVWRNGGHRFIIHASYTGNEKELGQGAEWVAEPVKVPVKPLAPKRTKKVSPLTRISQLLPMKLAKI